MHKKDIIKAGEPIESAKKVLVMVHGRGANAEDILTLAQHLDLDGYAILAPQATNNTWYPFSFMAPPLQNEPWLSSALAILKEIEEDLLKAGKASNDIYFLGFSQGACLTLEYITRNAKRYGGIIAFTGGLIGDELHRENYKGNFDLTPIFIGTSDPDPHVPVWRVKESTELLTEMNASVKVKTYPGMGHTISGDELNEARGILVNQLTS
jgi:phospholipase/carboxylesterase